MSKKIAAAVVAVVLIGLSCFRLTALNTRYPPPEIRCYATGQAAPYEPFTLMVNNAAFMDEARTQEIFQDELLDDQNLRCIVVDLTVQNKGTETGHIEISSFILESGAWKNGIHYTAFLQLNEDQPQASLLLTLEPGESRTLRLPYTMIESHFRPVQWKTVEHRTYSLTYSLYPVKQTIDVLNG